jgi:hypothetical protein
VVVQKKSPTWSDVKAKLVDFDRASLQGLVKDLYGASKGNQAFLHARFGLGADVLKPYKAGINRWLWPDLLNFQGQEGNYRLQEGYRATRRACRADGVLLRARLRFQQCLRLCR